MTKVKENEIQHFIKEYKLGKSLYRISKETNFTPPTIKYWLFKNGIKLRKTKFDFSHKKTRKLNESVVLQEYVEEKRTLIELSEKYGVTKDSIKYYLYKNSIPIREKNSQKGGFTEEEKKEIIRLYVEEKRGAMYIATLFNRADCGITYWLNKWKIPKNSRSEISKKIREVYGSTKGFSGRKHKKESKELISSSGKEAWNNDIREPKIGKSRTYLTKHGKVLGSYEVAYLQKLLESNEELPNIVHKRYKTPFGSYMPDFEFDDRFIEIKSKFTLMVAKGQQPSKKGVFTNKQWKKINWLSENIKKVDIIVVEKKEAKLYFEIAEKNGFILN